MASYWVAVAVALETGTAVCAGFNSLYFLNRLASLDGRNPGRMIAVAVLALISLAMMLEALSLLAISAEGREAYVDTPGWLPARVAAMLASATVTAMLVRKEIGR